MMRVVVILSILVLSGLFWWFRTGSEAPPGGPAAPTPASAGPNSAGAAVPGVIAARVEEREFAERVEALGTLKAEESIEITANVTEIVEELKFDDGDFVERGQLLARLNGQEEQAALEAAMATLREQEREIKRLDNLVEDGAVSEVRLEEYRTQRDIAEQRVEEANAKLSDRSIVAPFRGVLGTRQVSPGALVRPGSVLTTLDALDTMKLDFTVPETFMQDLEAGLTIEAASAAYPKEQFVGEVTHVDPRIDPVTRSVTVRARLDNPDLKLRPGMLMRVGLASRPRRSPCIPERGLVTRQTTHTVFKLENQDGTPVVRRVPVEVGRRQPGYVEILSGLQAGDRVVADGVLGLTDGKPVKVAGEFAGPSEAYNPVGDTGDQP